MPFLVCLIDKSKAFNYSLFFNYSLYTRIPILLKVEQGVKKGTDENTIF